MIKHLYLCVLLANIVTTTPVYSQLSSGSVLVNRLGVSYQDAFGVDLGLLSYGTWLDDKRTDFLDISFGVESIFARTYIFSPKINIDIGAETFNEVFLLAMGVDVARPTDFSRSTWTVTPKAGVAIGTFIRMYYGYHLVADSRVHPDLGKHRISIELNRSAFHQLLMGL